MSTRGGPEKGIQARRDAINAKTREALAVVLDKLEKSLRRLRDVEAHASPVTERLRT